MDELTLPGFGTDCALVRLVRTQRGVVTRRQLLAAGLSSKTIDRRIAAGWLHPLHRGVYAVGHGALALLAAETAALLACGAGSMLSHRSAAALWGLVPDPPATTEVTVAGADRRRHRPRIRLSCIAAIDHRDSTRRDGLAITRPARTIVDLASVVDEHRLARALEQMEILRLARQVNVEQALLRAPRSRGTATLRALLRSSVEPRSRGRTPSAGYSSCFGARSSPTRAPTPSCSVTRSISSGRATGSSPRSTATNSTARAPRSNAIADATRSCRPRGTVWSASPGGA